MESRLIGKIFTEFNERFIFLLFVTKTCNFPYIASYSREFSEICGITKKQTMK